MLNKIAYDVYLNILEIYIERLNVFNFFLLSSVDCNNTL